MKQRHLPGLLIDYVNWQARLVPARPRAVSVGEEALRDARWKKHATEIEAFLVKVRTGDDLTSHLSTQALTRGVTPAAQHPNAPPEARWRDKDFVLNVMGFHHFHLVAAMGGPDERSDDLIFARVSRGQFDIVGIFDHSAFKDGTPERQRLFEVHDRFLSSGMTPGQVYVGPLIAMSGHTFGFVRYAQECAKLIRQYDPLLDDVERVRQFFDEHQLARPKTVKVEWMFQHLDLGFYEKTSRTLFFVQKGWI